jgi:sugar phosphate isomerase/epimerase
MKISAWVFTSDLLPNKRTIVEKLGNKGNLFKNTNPKEVFDKLKTSGVDGIELLLSANFSDTDFQYLKKIFEKDKVVVNSIHQPLRLVTKTDIKEIEMLFSFAKKFNAKLIVLHLQSAKEQIFDKKYLERLHQLQKEYDIKLTFENTQKFRQVFNKKRFWEAKEFAKVVRAAGFSITLDTTHLGDTGGNIIDFYNENKDLIVNIQLSDYKAKWPSPGLHLVPGKGDLPMREFLKVLKVNNYDGFITMEIKTNLEGLCESAKFIKQGLS